MFLHRYRQKCLFLFKKRCFGIMEDHGNFGFKLFVELGYVFLSLRL
jgi:hypothetical protein